MKVKNYIVENYQLLMDSIEEELCKKGISYVRIDNEIHFLDQIIRFLDFEVDKREIIAWGFSKIAVEVEDRLAFPNLSFDDTICFVPERIVFDDDKCYQLRNKNNFKRESNLVKQKLKKYSR